MGCLPDEYFLGQLLSPAVLVGNGQLFTSFLSACR